MDLDGSGPDGNYRIHAHDNDCDPSCGGGTITTTELTWDGTGYIEGDSWLYSERN